MKNFFKSHVKLCIAVLALSLVTVGATLALMVSQSNSVTNNFTAADIDTEIKEELGSDMTKQVSITNQGPSDAYVRARIMVSGVKSTDVVVVGNASEATESDKVYLVMQNNGDSSGKWTKEDRDNSSYSDDFYYYLDVLPGTDSQPDSAEARQTSDLLTKVVLGKDLQGDRDFLDKFSVAIYHESVLAIDQSAPINLAKVKSAFDAVDDAATNP